MVTVDEVRLQCDQMQKLYELEQLEKRQHQRVLLVDSFGPFWTIRQWSITISPGGDFKNVKTASAEECKALCKSLQKCVAYTFETGGCQLKSSAPPIKKRNTGAVTGLIPEHFVCLDRSKYLMNFMRCASRLLTLKYFHQMQNQQGFFIKYKNNQPVPIDTAYGRGPTGNLPLTIVAHLVAAFQARPGSLLANTDSGLITLHSYNDGVETTYNSWDPLTVLGENGRLGTSPLIIRSVNEETPLNAEALKRKVTFEETVLESLKYLKVATKKNSDALEPLVQDFLKKFYYTNDTRTRTKVSRGDYFKKDLLSYYYDIQMKVDEVKCMISGVSFPSKVVIAGHLFKFCWADSCEARLDFINIDNPRNGLLMFKPFEFAFDNSHICFQYNSDNGLFHMKILYPELKKLTIREYIKIEKEIDESRLLKSRDEWIAALSKEPEVDIACVTIAVDNLMEILDKPFSDFEGNHVLSGLDSKTKCFGRCLSFQASMAQHMALNKGWISADEVSSPMFSDLGEKKKEQILAWIPDLSNSQFLPILAIDE